MNVNSLSSPVVDYPSNALKDSIKNEAGNHPRQIETSSTATKAEEGRDKKAAEPASLFDFNQPENQQRLEELNQNIQKLQSYLRFEKDESSDQMIFFIKNAETDEVIRQIPSEELLSISKNISQYLDLVNQEGLFEQKPIGLLTNEVV